jgi:uncharacterized membrane protein YedE/YeeE
VQVDAGTATLLVAGLLVGIGTRDGAGCTSGHGICGLWRRALGGFAFGAGWGLAGYCPGPALASLASGGKPLIFAAAMIAGMVIFALLERLPSRGKQAA